MPSHAEHAYHLLIEAAGFFRSIGAQDAALQKQMLDNAALYARVAKLLNEDPFGITGHKTHIAMAHDLLKDAAVFFRKLGQANPPLAEQMEETADVFDQLATVLMDNPAGLAE